MLKHSFLIVNLKIPLHLISFTFLRISIGWCMGGTIMSSESAEICFGYYHNPRELVKTLAGNNWELLIFGSILGHPPSKWSKIISTQICWVSQKHQYFPFSRLADSYNFFYTKYTKCKSTVLPLRCIPGQFAV